MSEMAQQCRVDESGIPYLNISVSISDAVRGTNLAWRTGLFANQIARLAHQVARHPTPEPPLTLEQVAARKLIAAQEPQIRTDVEDLGTRTIAGVAAHGSRTTITFAPGARGNELPIVITHEIWHSDELGLNLMRDDPSQGRTTMEVEELTRAEPDPSVFAPPEGDTIQDDQAAASGTLKP